MLALVALACAGFLSTLVLRMTDPVVPLLARDFGVPAADLALLVTAYAIPYAICQLGFGALGDHFGRVKVVRLAVSLLAVFIATTAMVPDYGSMLVVRVLCGGVGGGIIPLGIASIGDRVPLERRQVAISRFMTAVILGQMTGALFTGVAAEYVPWRTIYWVYAGIAAAVAVGLFSLPAQPIAVRSGSFLDAFGNYGRILMLRRAQTLLPMAAIEGVLLMGLVGFLPIYLASERHFSSGEIGAAVGAYGIGGLMFSALATPLIRIVGGYGLLRLGGALSGLSATAIAIAGPFWFYAILSALIGFSFFCMHSNLQMRATEMAPQARGAAVAVFASSLFFGSGAGPWTFGHLLPVLGFNALFAAVGACLVAFGFVAATVLRRQEQPA